MKDNESISTEFHLYTMSNIRSGRIFVTSEIDRTKNKTRAI